jgi:sorbitol-specific phosphotransferase system component IIBC
MSDFFKSEIVMEELREINELQEDVYVNIMNFGRMTKEEQLEHVDKLSTLLEKQKVMYARLSLSDDPDALEMKENLRNSMTLMGFSADTDMNTLFQSMRATIDSLRESLDT